MCESESDHLKCSGLPSWTEGRILLPSQAAGEEWDFVPTLVFSPESDVGYNDGGFEVSRAIFF